ncbi:54S ribosomal protein L51 [Penicillium atrosanguineum]|uniref:54S ribosomal protein L51 n=1 Tax=Penicillium atrosanguineum TaxID=1132637 RepID=UPI0023982A05|nr:54S ribosomal protein L51 [Penicillium atrosanguineum]KAJ5310164.1 54S ribosomal protein L51 [Penicillium atrosanguineum]
MSVFDPNPPLRMSWRDKIPDLRVPYTKSFLGSTAMSDEPGVLFMGARSKRTPRQMSQESSDESHDTWHRHFHPPPPNATGSRPARLPPIRTPRDGFDFRRPAPLTSQEEDVIDLTNEPETPPQRTHAHPSESRTLSTSRPPRFGRNILADVVDLEEEADDDPGEGPSSSPEVQFVRATTRPRAQPPPRGQWDPVAMISSTLARGFRTRQDAEDRRMLSSVSLLHSRRVPPLHRLPTDHMIFSGDGSVLNGFGPGFLDYGHSSFEMRPPTPPEPRPQRQVYKAPSPAPEGFTRTLGEDDVAVCPNCEWELGTGEGKRQEIWVSKPCGHVYCGECAENRSMLKAKRAQAPQKTKPFAKCQVDGCGKPVSAPTAMIHLYL